MTEPQNTPQGESYDPYQVAFGVCTLIFCSLVAGILLLCSNKDR